MIRTIRAKFIVGFFFIFCISFLLLNQLVSQSIETSNKKIVAEDLIGLKKNSSIYVRQAFLINHFTNDQLYFGQMAEEMVQDLRHSTSSSVSAYTVDGKMLYASDKLPFSGADEDLKQALLGKTAYTISYSSGNTSVLYSYPVVIDGTKVGILRFAKDFSLLYEQSDHTLAIIFYIALAIFAVAFLFSYILSRHITIPLIQLTKASTEVMNGNLDIRIGFRRRDEIGKLAANFSSMIEKIKAQITRIEKDRDRLEEVNVERKQFYDNVTHELKTPLTTILGYAEMIREIGERDESLFNKGMDHIVDESKRLHGMVLALLEMSKQTMNRDDFEQVEAGQIVRDVCEAMQVKAKRYSKKIDCHAEDGLFVNGDGDKLRQLFINLIDNAIKYSFAHSDIHVEAKREEQLVRFAFINKGETISEAYLSRIFEPFYRADNKQHEAESVGLGLGICKNIVNEHHGVIRIESEHQQTTVFIDMPYAQERREPL
ncbi:cell wall metabolism sensor histidine kinase WalK [Bacillus sp. FJAT-26390]|uniref:sensor histidine kinase n=1 Tax=Bacillus sp. FJAT-26390 TaxID=1743142 RepID=UPI00080806E4|nr:HAMP domain-containing sensor histidine kinase [Bacillus sp. FJAT-26390]OBZ15976.1 two-component sensor histidine kinase [Bacillus sp. FJAT-26390]